MYIRIILITTTTIIKHKVTGQTDLHTYIHNIYNTRNTLCKQFISFLEVLATKS